jgi:hypothetical protein
MDINALEETVRRKLFRSHYHCKGVIYNSHHLEHLEILHVVGPRTDVSIEDDWGDQ